MSLVETDKLRWCNIIDSKKWVLGVALVKRGFVAQLHRHSEAENYYFIWGTGRMQVGDKVSVVTSPQKIKIGGNVPHAMTPLSSYVVLAYTFRKGPFRSIVYDYLDSEL